MYITLLLHLSTCTSCNQLWRDGSSIRFCLLTLVLSKGRAPQKRTATKDTILVTALKKGGLPMHQLVAGHLSYR